MILELAGPPGSGKSTLANALVERIPNARYMTFPYFREPAQVPFFVKNLLKLMPTVRGLQRNADKKRLTRRDIARMVILKGWPKSLARQRRNPATIIVLDEGPVCQMARLLCFGSDLIKSPRAAPWRDTVFSEWAQMLDMIVRLESPGSVLESRVRSRNIPHEISGLTSEQAVVWLENLRVVTNNVIGKLQAKAPSLKVLDAHSWGRSSEESLEALVKSISEAHRDLLGAARLPS
jgi:energy-coupling factor transporter ATP-binding protein EcfA2